MEEKEVPFSQRPDFSDLSPVEQNDGLNPVCPIAYTPEFLDSMNYFRAILGKDERTERAFEVCTRVIKYNSACYTAWYFKRLVIEAISYDKHKEMADTYEMCKNHPKNYQIWYHRRWLVQQTQDASNELSFTAEILAEDAKNYHAWSHRQWVIKTFNLFENELAYVETLITSDVRNNSAWNQRYFVIHHTGLTKETILTEIIYAQSKICLSPNNECPWNYMIGLCKGTKISSWEDIVSFCAEKEGKWPFCANLLSLIMDIEEEKENYEKANQVCTKLKDGVDDIHKKYWAYRLSLIPTKS
jgi:protein farnesyltransferase/geranylgeranyltransferase type-1 subunit alpha